MEGEAVQVGHGMVTGGWGYVWAVYGITWTTLVVYAISVFVRSRGETRA